MRVHISHSRTWQSHAGKPDRAIPGVPRDLLIAAKSKGPKPVPSKLTITRIKKTNP